MGLGIATKLAPAWFKALKHTKVLAVGPESITFTQDAIGKVQISRKRTPRRTLIRAGDLEGFRRCACSRALLSHDDNKVVAPYGGFAR